MKLIKPSWSAPCSKEATGKLWNMHSWPREEVFEGLFAHFSRNSPLVYPLASRCCPQVGFDRVGKKMRPAWLQGFINFDWPHRAKCWVGLVCKCKCLALFLSEGVRLPNKVQEASWLISQMWELRNKYLLYTKKDVFKIRRRYETGSVRISALEGNTGIPGIIFDEYSPFLSEKFSYCVFSFNFQLTLHGSHGGIGWTLSRWYLASPPFQSKASQSHNQRWRGSFGGELFWRGFPQIRQG